MAKISEILHDKEQAMNYIEAAQDLISQYDTAGFHFMKKILNINFHDIVVKKDAWLSDFTGYGLDDKAWHYIANLYEAAETNGLNYSEGERIYHKIKNEYWDNWVIEKIEHQYHFILSQTNYPLCEIFKHILTRFEKEKLEQENASFTFSTYRQHHQQQIVETTLNPFFYAEQTGIPLEEAKIYINKRKELNFYHPYRPSYLFQ